MKRIFSTLIFDLDGTLSDPREGIANCVNAALLAHGFASVASERVEAEIGPPLDTVLTKSAPMASTTTIGSMIATYRNAYARCGYAQNTVYPQVPEALARLAGAGIRLGVCTSKRREFAEKILSLFGLLHLFAFIDGGEVGVRKTEQLARLLADGSIDDAAVMIGDRDVDIVAAHDNGLRSIGVLWGFGSARELAAARPTYTVNTVADLVGLVG